MNAGNPYKRLKNRQTDGIHFKPYSGYGLLFGHFLLRQRDKRLQDYSHVNVKTLEKAEVVAEAAEKNDQPMKVSGKL
jgi:hypothetical protein